MEKVKRGSLKKKDAPAFFPRMRVSERRGMGFFMMKRSIFPFLFLCFALGCASTNREMLEKAKQYHVKQGFGRRFTGDASKIYYFGIGDSLLVGMPDLSPKPVRSNILPDGTIVLPYLGPVFVAGKTIEETDEILTNILKKYLKNVDETTVSVGIVGMNSKKIFVVGEVGRIEAAGLSSRLIRFVGDQTVADVLLARGLSLNADLDDIRVVRGDPKDPLIITVNLKDILNGDTTTNIQLREDDIVIVPSTILGEIGYFIQKILFPVRSIFQVVFYAIRAMILPYYFEMASNVDEYGFRRFRFMGGGAEQTGGEEYGSGEYSTLGQPPLIEWNLESSSEEKEYNY